MLKCWCGKPAEYINEATCATPTNLVCADHVKDGFAVLSPTTVRFLTGDCHLLAQEIHRRTGWPMVAIVPNDDPSDWIHVLVETPAGTLLDVQGEHDAETLCATYDGYAEDGTDLRDFPWPGWTLTVKPGHAAYMIDTETVAVATSLIEGR